MNKSNSYPPKGGKGKSHFNQNYKLNKKMMLKIKTNKSLPFSTS
jgi:hypothetical protein